MKVLLTGATGFVGSHVLDSLRQRGVAVRILVRATSDNRFIRSHLRDIEAQKGSIGDPASLRQALAGVTHVIHCAGATKALSAKGFFQVNQDGTRNLVEAINQAGGIQRLVHISSLAAAGPAALNQPRRESDPPAPVSTYGRSKLAGEQEVSGKCQTDFVILRPPAVYGVRDFEFLRLFKAIKGHVRPTFGGGGQQLSFVYVKDLAEAAVHALTHPALARQNCFVAAREIVTARQFGLEIASHLSARTVPLPLPNAGLWLVCAGQEMLSRLTRRPSVISLQKYAELTAPAWTCDPTKLEESSGFVCRTTIYEGVPRALDWYRQSGWL